MKTLKICMSLLFTVQMFGQVSENCGINPSIRSTNGCSFGFNQLMSDDLNTYQTYCSNIKSSNLSDYTYLDNDGSFENELFKSYPSNFKKTPTGFDFINSLGDVLNIQKINSDSDSRQYQNYEFVAEVGHFIIIYQTGYESWNHLLIDLKNFNYYMLPGEPVFITPQLIYGYTNYYGNGELTMIDIERANDVTFSFQNEISTIKYSNNISMGILVEFKSIDCAKNQFLNISQ